MGEKMLEKQKLPRKIDFHDQPVVVVQNIKHEALVYKIN